MNRIGMSLILTCVFVFTVLIIGGVGTVSGASLNVSEMSAASDGVNSYIVSHSNDVPGFVKVDNKNSSTPSFLKSATKMTVQLNSGSTAPVTISSVGKPPSPSGSAKGTLSKSEYVKVANNVYNFINTNGRAPNYASSSLGNIRYEALVYAYSRIISFYKNNGRMPNNVEIRNIAGIDSTGVIIDTLPPTATANLASGTYNSTKTVTLSVTDNLDTNPRIYYSLNNAAYTYKTKTTTLSLGQGVHTLKFYGQDASGRVSATQTRTYTIDTTTPTVTANLATGIYNSTKTVTLSAADNLDTNPRIYYSLDNAAWSSSVESVTLSLNQGIHNLKFYGQDAAGHISATQTRTYTIDTVAPTVSANLISGTYNNTKTVTLTASDNLDTNPQIYYSLNNGTSWSSSDKSVTLSLKQGFHALQFYGQDAAGHKSATQTRTYTISIFFSINSIMDAACFVEGYVDTNHCLPVDVVVAGESVGMVDFLKLLTSTTLNINSSTNTTIPLETYNNALNSSENITSGFIDYNEYLEIADHVNSYMEVNGTAPVSVSTSLGDMGFQSLIYMYSVVLNAYNLEDDGMVPGFILVNPWITITNQGKVYNIGTGEVFDSIQSAIDNARENDTITVGEGTYNENVIINKKLILESLSGKVAVVNSGNPNLPVFTINSSGTGSVIQNLIITGSMGNAAIYLNNTMNNTILRNNITGSFYGISSYNSNNNWIQANNINNNTHGILIYGGFNNTIQYNIINDNEDGIVTNNTSTLISGNTITGNDLIGILTTNSSNTIRDNKINGSNNGIYSTTSCNIINSNDITENTYGMVLYNSSDTIHFNRIAENSYGLKNEVGNVDAGNNWWGTNNPSNPTDLWIVSGNVTYNPWLILRLDVSNVNSAGNSSVTANLTCNNLDEDTSQYGLVPNGLPVSFTTSNGTIVNTAYTFAGRASTILNLNTTQPQNVTVNASLDDQTVSATRFITMGVAVLNITSTAIDNNTGQPLNISYNVSLTDSVAWLSIVWSPTTINGTTNPSEELQVIVNGNVVLSRFVYNVNGQGTDTITFNLMYPGVTGFNLVFNDSDGVVGLNFPGDNVTRTGRITYNGTFYDGVHSYAIATTKITKDIFDYWLSQGSLYQVRNGMSDAYATFMTSLMVIYYHDVMADGVSSDLNVTWSRTRPAVVSTHQDTSEVYLTLDCDHSMGMTAVGASDDLWTFNYLTSSSISVIEDAVMGGVTGESYQSYNSGRLFKSVVSDIVDLYLKSDELLESFLIDNYLVLRGMNGYDYLVFDLKTGLMRDINIIGNFSGSSITYDIRRIANLIVMQDPTIGGVPGIPVILHGNPWYRVSNTFYWDGLGKVFLASETYGNPYYDVIGMFGSLEVVSTWGSVSFNENPSENWTWIAAPDISGILVPEMDNTVSLVLTSPDNDSLLGPSYGLSRISLVQVIITEITEPPINEENVMAFAEDIGNDIAENLQDPHTVMSVAGGIFIVAGCLTIEVPIIGVPLIIAGVGLTAYGSGLTEDPTDPYNWLDFTVSMGSSFVGGGAARAVAGPIFKAVGKRIMVSNGKVGPAAYNMFKFTTTYNRAVGGSFGVSFEDGIRNIANDYIKEVFTSTMIDQLRG